MSMLEDILTDASLQKLLQEFLAKPKGIRIDENTHRRLEELCSQMASVYGLVESFLQLALTKEEKERAAYIKTALDISSRATEAIKLFLGEWSALVVEETNLPQGMTRDDNSQTAQKAR